MYTLATIRRIVMQLKADPRTIFLIVGVPFLLIALTYYAFVDVPTMPGQRPFFDSISAMLIAIVPMFLMFIVTSVSMLRERTTGTLERILTTPTSKFSLLFAYALVFAVLAAIQGISLSYLVRYGFDIKMKGHILSLVFLSVTSGIVGVSMGLAASAFAKTEFQVVQFMPAFILPQFILCGLIVPRDQMPTVLEKFSNILPMTWAVDIAKSITDYSHLSSNDALRFLGLIAVSLAFLLLAAMLMKRVTK